VQLAPGVWVAKSNLVWSFSRSSGPGGQNVNKVNTKAELRMAVSAPDGLDDRARERLRNLAGGRMTQEDEIVIQCDEGRSQRGNRRIALERLCELVGQAAAVPKRRRKTRPSRGAIERRLERKRERAEKKERRAWRPGE